MNLRESFFARERLIEDLSSDDIIRIISSAAWKTLNQEITSMETNNDKNPMPDEKLGADEKICGVDAFSDLEFEDEVKRVIDVGGGKYDFSREYLRKIRSIDLLVWDPYNRTLEHNKVIQDAVTRQKVDAATSMAVLNVIPEIEVRLAHITTLWDALKLNGKAYFKVWPGEGYLKGSYKPTVNSYGFPGFQANAYLDRFLREIQLVFGYKNIEIRDNMILATKASNVPTSKAEIERIQELSKTDLWKLKQQCNSPVRLFDLHTKYPNESDKQFVARLGRKKARL